MKINYGVNRRRESGGTPKYEHKNGKLNLPQYTDSDWEKDEVQQKIREIIRGKHPGWLITGYGLSEPAKS